MEPISEPSLRMYYEKRKKKYAPFQVSGVDTVHMLLVPRMVIITLVNLKRQCYVELASLGLDPTYLGSRGRRITNSKFAWDTEQSLLWQLNKIVSQTF